MGSTIAQAVHAMTAGEYFNGHGKREKDGPNYQDEVAIIGDWSLWLYHANPIAALNRSDGTLLLSSCGFQTKTTKERLSALPGVRITQKNYAWYRSGEPFKDSAEEIEGVLGRELYHQTDGWRGYEIHPFAVASAQDTGSWSDSPCPTDSVTKELEKVQGILRAAGIRSYQTWRETSNVFCIMRFVAVKACDYARAKDALAKNAARLDSLSYASIA